MLDFIKYFPLQLRWTNTPCTPKGPVFSSAKPVKIKYEGNILTFKAPRHSPEEWRDQQVKPSRGDYGGVGLRYFNDGVKANDHWNSHVCFMRRWAYWGPWFSGAAAAIHMFISIVGRDQRYAYKDVSFFHPKMFENVLVEYLNDSYGYTEGDQRWADFRGPLEWNTNKDIGIFSARFQIQQIQLGDACAEPVRKLFFPVSDDRFIEVSLNPSVPLATNDEGVRIVNPSFMYSLVDSILDSFSIELSLEVQAKLDEIKQDCPDMSLSKTFAPLNWPVKQTGGEVDELLLNN